jgi:Flp pilus assembly protein TadG
MLKLKGESLMMQRIKAAVLRRPRSLREWGQTMALMAIALPVIIGGLGFAMDVGNLYFNHYKMQSAVDAAALAGAQCLPGQASCTATTTASAYATKNGAPAGGVTVVGPSYNTTTCPSGGAYSPCQITVSATKTVPYYFARLVGMNSGTVKVTATAAGGSITTITSTNSQEGGISGLVPIGLQYNSGWQDHHTLSLVYNSNPAGCGTTGTSLPGDWNWLRLGGSGTHTVTGEVTSGYTGTVDMWETGDTSASNPDAYVTPQPGAGQPPFDAMKTRIGGATCTYGCECNSPCAITILLVDWAAMTCGGGACTAIPVMGFAEMCVEGVTKAGACSNITAHAITCPVPGGSWTTTSSSTSTFQDGALSVKLFE